MTALDTLQLQTVQMDSEVRMATTSAETLLRTALNGKDHLEALALIHLGKDHLVFLDAAAPDSEDLCAALEAILLRATTDVEALEDLQDETEVLYYDTIGRQLILLDRQRKERYLLSALVAPRKAYKQTLKRLVKNLKAAFK